MKGIHHLRASFEGWCNEIYEWLLYDLDALIVHIPGAIYLVELVRVRCWSLDLFGHPVLSDFFNISRSL
jgi:hypothetical protein